ncbi:MAG: FKBP-type peptidyl-prolyl cis-trans isomerase [Bacteroidota bacterium]|jgi:FKBP-type peptidyl-prolyl cis-trans isomerase
MLRLLAVFLLLSFAACSGDKPAPKRRPLTEKEMREGSVKMHTWDRQRQADEIDQYARRKGWNMEITASGLRWMKLKEGSGKELAVPGQIAKVAYTIRLMDGTLCYTSEKDGPRSFEIGRDDVEPGIHEGVQLMRTGDKMRFILPSHLAHGLTGDNDRIPPLAALVCEVELLSLRQQ